MVFQDKKLCVCPVFLKNIAIFVKDELFYIQKSINMTKGSEWRIWDLHLHTPASYDYKDKSVTNEEIVNELVENGVSVVAITDHNIIDVERINELKQLGVSKGLYVLPGIELCSELGGSESVHFIGIFPEYVDIESVWTKIQGQCNLTKADIESRGGHERICCEFVKTCELILGLGGIITVHAGNKSNSLESIKNNLLVKQELKQDLLSRFNPLLDVGKPEDAEGYRKYVFPDIKFSLPIIMCSDNHNIWDYQVKEKMWIKADPTFEGLKQVIYEPEERVRIQTTMPDDKNIYQVIEQISLDEDPFWKGTIYLNPNLNTIIGGRSTGKSTLLKAIAAVHDNKNVDSDDFVMKHLSGITVHWKDGTDQIGREIEYFKQSYMHDIAFNPSKTSELVESIIRNRDSSGILNEYYAHLNEISRKITESMFSLFQKTRELRERKEELTALGKRDGVAQQINILKSKVYEIQKTSKITPEQQNLFEANLKKIKELEIDIERADKDLKLFERLLIVSPFDNYFEEHWQMDKLSFRLNQYELSREYNNLKNKTEFEFVELVRKYQEETRRAKNELQEQCRQVKESESFVNGQKNIESNKELKDINDRIAVEENKLSQIEILLSAFEKIKEERNRLFNEIITLHCSIKKKAEDVKSRLNISYDGLSITVDIEHYRDALKDFLEDRLNLRGSERQEYFATIVRNYDSDNQTYAKDFLKKLLLGELQLKNGYDALNVATEFFTKTWYSLDYDLFYQGDLFKHMSEGKQAFVILKLLLDFSEKTCPILIDQPEDSLDNRAIYNELVAYIKKKKKERQIILVTHNSNVVVSADAENVIVANQDGSDSHNRDGLRFQYVNGALECTRPKSSDEKSVLHSQGIREHVCDILEGGRAAFEKREQKYGFKS